MPEQTISLRDLRHHITALDRLVTEAYAASDTVATLDFLKVRGAAKAILELLPVPTPVVAKPAAMDARKNTAPAHGATVPDVRDLFPGLRNMRVP